MNQQLHYFLLGLFSKPTRHKNLYMLRPTAAKIDKQAFFEIKEALIINKPWVGLRNRYALVEIERNARIVADRFIFRSCDIQVTANATLNLGAGSTMNDGGRIVCSESITIGKNTLIAHNVTIRDNDSHTIVGKPFSAPVTIGDHVWICDGVTVLKGVTIGDGAIVGAGSVVTKDVPPRCLAVGNPARVVRSDVEWER